MVFDKRLTGSHNEKKYIHTFQNGSNKIASDIIEKNDTMKTKNTIQI